MPNGKAEVKQMNAETEKLGADFRHDWGAGQLER